MLGWKYIYIIIHGTLGRYIFQNILGAQQFSISLLLGGQVAIEWVASVVNTGIILTWLVQCCVIKKCMLCSMLCGSCEKFYKYILTSIIKQTMPIYKLFPSSQNEQ